VGKAHQVTPELGSAVPRLEGEGRAPREPEVGLEESGVDWSAMLIGLSMVSGSSTSRSIVRMCRSVSPNAGAVWRLPPRTRRALDDVLSVLFHCRISPVTVWVASSVGMESNSAKVQTYLLSNIRPPRRT